MSVVHIITKSYADSHGLWSVVCAAMFISVEWADSRDLLVSVAGTDTGDHAKIPGGQVDV